jgi:hypothetical protein
MRHILVPIALFVMITTIAVGGPLIRAWARRIESRSQPALPPDAQARLERMEAAIETIALEVERIAEGQRFTTKLLAERGVPREPLMAPATPSARDAVAEPARRSSNGRLEGGA